MKHSQWTSHILYQTLFHLARLARAHLGAGDAFISVACYTVRAPVELREYT